MKTGRCASILLIVVLVLSVAGNGCETDAADKSNRSQEIPEIGDSLASGSVLMNVSGGGYKLGDIVRISTDVNRISKGDVVLFDWRKTTGGLGGLGPTHMIGEVIGLPGDDLDLSTFLKYTGRDGKEKKAWFSTFEKRGAKNYDSNIALRVGDYLVETDRNVIIVDHSAIGALVLERLGHDEDAAREMKHRVY